MPTRVSASNSAVCTREKRKRWRIEWSISNRERVLRFHTYMGGPPTDLKKIWRVSGVEDVGFEKHE